MSPSSAAGSRTVNLADNTVGEEEIDAVVRVMRSGWLSQGPVTAAFEAEFAAALEVPEAVAVSSGTAALHLALLALGLRPGDEVVVPSLSFVASAATTALHGAVPVFADVVSEDEPTIDPEHVRRLLSPRTAAVVVMHYAGYPARVREIVELAAAHGIPVIEDAAHAPLVRHHGRMLGTVGDIGCFSFHATKNLTTGEGGMVVARDPGTVARIRALRSHCISRPAAPDQPLSGGADHDAAGIGLNYRPTEISSAIGRVQLTRLAADRVRRTRLVRRYDRRLAAIPGLGVPFAAYELEAAHHLRPVLLPHGTPREAVRAALAAAGIQTSVHYRPTHQFSYYREHHPAAPLPVSEAMAARLLSLPLHARMTEPDVDHVVDVLRRALTTAPTPPAPPMTAKER